MRRHRSVIALFAGCICLASVALGCGLTGRSNQPAAAGKDVADQVIFLNSRVTDLEINTETHFKILEGWLNQIQDKLASLEKDQALLAERLGIVRTPPEDVTSAPGPEFSPGSRVPANPPDEAAATTTEPTETTPTETTPTETTPTETTPPTEVTEPVKPPIEERPVTPAMSETERADAQLLRLRACKPEEVAAVAKEMRPLSKYVVKQLVEGLNDPDYEFRPRAERALEQLDPVVVMADIVATLNNPNLRIQAVRIIGAMGTTTEDVKTRLREYLINKEDAELAFYAAGTLVGLKVKDGVPELIKHLKSEDEIRRLLAFHTLNKMTGKSFGYSFNASVDTRNNAVRQWEAWWEEVKETLWAE
ncbi:MAG: hypothetical protein RDV41_10445 [Planctomycetota bacterium]|nr:hypothetical protein [Planctomycetota bacterium]